MSDDPDIREQLNNIREQLGRITHCLIGDEKMGQRGLVTEMKSHDSRITRIEKAGIYLIGAGGMLGLIWRVWSEWPHH